MVASRLTPGTRVALFGKIEFDSYRGELQMMHPETEFLSGEAVQRAETASFGCAIQSVYYTLPKHL